MTEDEARAWIELRFGRQAVDLLDIYATMLLAENRRQNLIAPSTASAVWVRHLLDSAQLVPLATTEGVWLDIGSGAGLPGLVVAVLRHQPTILVEPRRRRAAFLAEVVARLGLQHVDIVTAKVETLQRAARVISARAVAPAEKLLLLAANCGTSITRWLLPRGHFTVHDLALLQNNWAGLFHMKQSLSDPGSTILVCDGPRAR